MGAPASFLGAALVYAACFWRLYRLFFWCKAASVCRRLILFRVCDAVLLAVLTPM